MSSFASALKSIVTVITMSPSSKPLLAVTIALAFIAGWFGFKKTIDALKFPLNSGFRPIASLALFIAICLISAAAASAYICPKISAPAVSRFLPLAAAILGLLVFAAPLACLLMKSKYLQTVSAFLVPVIAAALVVFLAKGIYGAIRHGEQNFSTTKERTEGVDDLLGR